MPYSYFATLSGMSLPLATPRAFPESALRHTHTRSGADLYLCNPENACDAISPFALSPGPRYDLYHSSPRLPRSSSFNSPGHDAFSTNGLSPMPRTPFHNLFASSPSGFWAAGESSMSPISRRGSQGLVEHFSSPLSRQRLETPTRKIQSSSEYQLAQKRPLTGIQDGDRSISALSPSSMSSLSSLGSSPLSSCSANESKLLLSSKPSRPSDLARKYVHSGPQDSAQSPTANIATNGDSSTRAATDLTTANMPLNYGHELLGRRTRLRRNRGHPRYTEEPDVEFDIAPDPPKKRRRNALAEHTSNKERRIVVSPMKPLSSSSVQPGSDQPATTGAHTSTYPNRTFPLRVPINAEFPLFYRRFPVSSYTQDGAARHVANKGSSDATFNAPRDAYDLYTPRFVKGRGTTKMGLCPCCCESVTRGGEGKKVWLSMKFSAFNYHMQYAHGISAMTGRPFSPPVEFRTVARTAVGKHEKSAIMQGKCHRCAKWVPVEGIKDVVTKVKEIYWWKHAAACHQGSTIDGEGDIFVEDETFKALRPA